MNQGTVGYTVIKSSYKGIEAEITYYIPEGKKYETWHGTIKNVSGKARKLKVFSYMEFSYYNATVDVNAEWARYYMTGKCENGIIVFDPSSKTLCGEDIYGFFGTSLETDGFDCWRDAFIRAYTDKGEKFGTNDDEYNKIFLNLQSWAVLSRLPEKEDGMLAFDDVNKYLFCEFGCISHYPASSGFDRDEKSFSGIQSGIKENGGVFYHASTWAVIAQTTLGRNEDAFKLYRATLPIRRNDISDRTLIEPYVYASAMLGPSHERYGAGSNSWLTGTASWMFFAVTQYILGFRPSYGGLTIDPCLPLDWNGFEMTRKYRDINCKLIVGKLPCENARAKALIVNGERIEGTFIPLDKINGQKEIVIEVVF